MQFQFTPLREGRQNEGDAFFNAYEFQFTPLREGRPMFFSASTILPFNFNSRPSARGDRCLFGNFIHFENFNSRPSARGDSTTEKTRFSCANFNSRPSARGDTERLMCAPIYCEFQFTPLREGRHAGGYWCVQAQRDFNSRPSARGDAVSSCVFSILLISIHAPPRGATYFFRQNSTNAYFNSRPSARGDQFALDWIAVGVYFNSRPSARGD